MAELSSLQRDDLGFLFDEYRFKAPVGRTAGASIIIVGGILILTGLGLTIASNPMWFLLIIASAIIFVWGCVIWLISFREHGIRVLLYMDGFVYETSRKVTTVRWEAIAEGVQLHHDYHNQLWLQSLKLPDGTRLRFDRCAERSTELTKAILIGYYRQQGIDWDTGLEYFIE